MTFFQKYSAYTHQTQNICMTFIQCWTNVEEINVIEMFCICRVAYHLVERFHERLAAQGLIFANVISFYFFPV